MSLIICGAAGKTLLPNIPDYDSDAPIVLSTLIDEKGSRQGVLAQLIHTPRSEKPLDKEFFGKLDGEEDISSSKDFSDWQVGLTQHPPSTKQVDLFKRFAELLPNGLAILDGEAEAVFVNDGFFKLTTNRGGSGFRAWPESIDTRDYERVMNAYREAFSSGRELQIEFRCAASEEEQWRLFLLRPLRKEADAGFICTVVDITEIKLAEISQQKAARDAQDRKNQQERFIDMVSHEIRNPLSAVLHLTDEIKAAASSLSKRFEDELLFEIEDAADTILVCVQHQNALVDDILSFSKLDAMMLSLSPAIVQPKWEFSSTLKVFQSELKSKGIGLHYALDVSYKELHVDYVMADFNRMKQVLINLVTNAIKFTAKKTGTRDISVAMGASTERPSSYPPNVVFFETTENQFHYNSTNSVEWGQGPAMYLMVAIKDTGIGISEENQKKLFEWFRQATPKTQENYGGSGLGLFISRKICQLHGGDVGVSSKEGVGSTFGFFFKVRRADESDAQRPTFNRQKSSRSSVGASESRVPQLDSPNIDRAQQETLTVESISSSDDLSSTRGVIRKGPHPKTNSRDHRVDGQTEELRQHSNQPLSEHPGISDSSNTPSLDEPPVECRTEAHPSSSTDDRFDCTANISHDIQQKRPSVVQGIQSEMPKSLMQGHGETDRQASSAAKISERQQHIQDEQVDNVLPKILLVEDNLINQKVLRRQLQSRSFQVSVANNGQEAIDAVKRRADGVGNEKLQNSTNTFDCILMDQEMPVKDGNTATIEIRELEEKANVAHGIILGVTANVREAQRNSMLEAGMDDVISKPYKVDELVERIKKLLSSR